MLLASLRFSRGCVNKQQLRDVTNFHSIIILQKLNYLSFNFCFSIYFESVIFYSVITLHDIELINTDVITLIYANGIFLVVRIKYATNELVGTWLKEIYI